MFPGDHDPKKVMSENTVNNALRAMGYDTNTEFVGTDSAQWHAVQWANQACGVMMLSSAS